MKLLFCPQCNDVLKLAYAERRCACGASGGRYLRDGRHAEVFGAAEVIGLHNATVLRALSNRSSTNPTDRQIEAWMFDRTHPRVARLTEAR